MQLGTQAALATGGFEFVRRHPRTLFSVPLTLHHLMPGGVCAAHGISLDSSAGGGGALVQGGLRVGETVSIDLPLPEGTLKTVAIVRHTSHVSSGFEFVGLTPEERQQIVSITGHS